MTVVDGSDDVSMSDDEVADSQPDNGGANGRKRSFSEEMADTQELAPDSSNSKRHRSTFGDRSASLMRKIMCYHLKALMSLPAPVTRRSCDVIHRLLM